MARYKHSTQKVGHCQISKICMGLGIFRIWHLFNTLFHSSDKSCKSYTSRYLLPLYVVFEIVDVLRIIFTTLCKVVNFGVKGPL